MVASLQTTTSDGKVKEIERRYGSGELYWPYIRLEPLSSSHRLKSISQADMATPVSEPIISGIRSQRTVRHGKPISLSAGIKTRSAVKIKEQRVTQQDLTTYTIQVCAPKGWPLTLEQWKRVIEIQSNQDCKIGSVSKKSLKEKIGVTKEKEKTDTLSSNQLQLGDAYVELECSLGGASGAIAKRDDKRDLRFATAVKSWEASELGRNAKGALIRQEFRNEYVESSMASKVQFVETNSVETTENAVTQESSNDHARNQQSPTPAASVDIQLVHKNDEAKSLEQEFENNVRYILMPEELKDKFKPLSFVSSCMKEKTEDECIILTSEMVEAAKTNREADIETAYERMKQLQTYNEIHVLGSQKTRCDLLETLFVDSQWSPGLKEALEVKNNKSATETLNKSASVMRKKRDTKTK